jgi:1,4-alpha-glucan branching enzyme
MTNTISATATATQLGLDHITESTPLGARLLADRSGVTFRVWAPAAREVRVLWDYSCDAAGNWSHAQEGVLNSIARGQWAGFIPGLHDGDRFLYHVIGPDGGTTGLKREPRAPDLSQEPGWPECHCLIYDETAFPWHDSHWKPPAFHELVIYQMHIGTWSIPGNREKGTFLDVIEKLPYLKSLGITAIQPLPIGEFPTVYSLGYNNVDPYSPETDYAVPDKDKDLDGYLDRINDRMREIDGTLVPYARKDILGTANQFRMMVDMCHVYGIAVLMDVVYNHAGGGFDGKSLYFFDGKARGNNNDSLYFTDKGWAGGLAFALWNDDVKQYLIDNAKYFIQECHCDGFRYDEVSVIRNLGGESGWRFCQWVTDTCHYLKPDAIHIAENWPVDTNLVNPTSWGGGGFDATLNDGLRNAVRGALIQAGSGRDAYVDMDRIAGALALDGFRDRWRAVQSVEDHDIVRSGRESRIAQLADPSNSRSWYARSRSRVALGLVLTAPGIPHVFMGQEFLEDKPWNDDPKGGSLVWWAGLEADRSMIDFLRFTRELIGLRHQVPGLKGEGLNVFHVHDANRIIAFQRWVPGRGQDVVVVASLSESTYYGYQLGFPGQGYWNEAFNSDVYDNWVNPQVAGNGGGIFAQGGPMHGLPNSAYVTIPANGILVFAR